MPDYPTTRRGDTVDLLHGEAVADPYRWLEDTWSDETAAWVKQQNELTEAELAASPLREELRVRLTELWNNPRRGVPFSHGGRWFQLRNTGLQPQSVLWTMAAPADEGTVALDPNTLSEDGTVALTSLAVSRDGRLMAYGTSAAGSDWVTWRIRDLDTGRDLDDVLEWSKFSGAQWSPDGGELFYSVLDAPQPGRELLAQSRTPRIVRHRLGTPQAQDVTVYSAPDQPEWIPSVEATDDGRFLVIVVGRGTFPEQQLHVLDLHDQAEDRDTAPAVTPLVGDFTSQVELVGNTGTTFYLRTDHEAPRGRIVAVELDRPGREHWREIVGESEDTLLAAIHAGGHLVLHYLHDACARIAVHALDGSRQREVDLGGLVSVTGLTGHADDPLVHIGLTSFTDPGSVWQHDLATGATTRLHETPTAYDREGFVTEQVFVASDDGTRIPVFLTHRRDVTPTGDVPVLLYGYGGFNIPVTPAFHAARLLAAERGGLYAVANLRGGGEHGRDWYDAGRLAQKQNVFDDFCAVARWLARAGGWSRPERIAIHGGSNGGLLVGACLTQHPELFGAAVPAVGVLDMLRFHTFTVGWAWTSDYGHPDDPEAFTWLRAYSPLHNVRPGTAYPPTLVLTGDHDDRVAPGHSFKFAAAMQAAQAGSAPVLIRIETSAGHGAGKPTQKLIDESADLLTFLHQTIGL